MSEQAGESDYGYDLVHEEVVAARPTPPSDAGRPAAPDVSPEPEDGGDLSYDLAHEVPRAEEHGSGS
jgi:hypothetical protein